MNDLAKIEVAKYFGSWNPKHVGKLLKLKNHNYPPANEASREVANLTTSKNLNTVIDSVK